ncbi:MAG TPA: hypothetical protein VIY28_03995 [Pseudonocardiaceae bacterium]
MTSQSSNLDRPDETRKFNNGELGVVGDQPCVALDWSASADYAKPAS